MYIYQILGFSILSQIRPNLCSGKWSISIRNMKIKLDKKNFDIFSLRTRGGVKTRLSGFWFYDRKAYATTTHCCSSSANFNELPSLGRMHIFTSDDFFSKDVEFKNGFVEIIL